MKLKRFQADHALYLPPNGSELSLETSRTSYPLYYMSYLGLSGIVQLLLAKEANDNAQDGLYDQALSTASNRGHGKVVQLLLGKGPNVNSEDLLYGNALPAASYGGHEEAVRLLLIKGDDVNAHRGRALEFASLNGKEAVVRLLLKNEADSRCQLGNSEICQRNVARSFRLMITRQSYRCC